MSKEELEECKRIYAELKYDAIEIFNCCLFHDGDETEILNC